MKNSAESNCQWIFSYPNFSKFIDITFSDDFPLFHNKKRILCNKRNLCLFVSYFFPCKLLLDLFALREKSFFWYVFSRIRTEYGEM